MKMEIRTVSESAVVCLLSAPAELAKQQRLWAFAARVGQSDTVVETVTGMNNLTVFLHHGTDPETAAKELRRLWRDTAATEHEGRLVEIPVVYGGRFGEDLAEVAAFHQTTAAEIVKRHTAPVYTVFMMGFQPGFPYLGGLPENLHTPRRATPRTEVPAGSVGIGGSQTGMYPFASPGGWQIIGRTSVALFDAQKQPPTLLAAGDRVRFRAERIEK